MEIVIALIVIVVIVIFVSKSLRSDALAGENENLRQTESEKQQEREQLKSLAESGDVDAQKQLEMLEYDDKVDDLKRSIGRWLDMLQMNEERFERIGVTYTNSADYKSSVDNSVKELDQLNQELAKLTGKIITNSTYRAYSTVAQELLKWAKCEG